MDALELEAATDLLLQNLEELDRGEEVDLLSSYGRVLKWDIYAPMENPPFDRSPLDGYTFHHSLTKGASKENPVSIPIRDILDAGREFDETLTEECLGIMTGAKIPSGCDCVIRQEDVEISLGRIVVSQEMKAYENFVHRGEDIKKGTLLMEKGERITHHHIGVLATMGFAKVPVRAKTKIGLLSTGDELTPVGEPLKPAKIYNSNLYMLASRMGSLGLEVKVVNICKDDPQAVDRAIEENIEDVDLFITTGGVSVGRKDIFHDVVKLPGNKKLFWRIKMQPGTPVLAWKKGEKLVVSLSGNPFAALINFELLVRPLLAKLGADISVMWKRSKATAEEEFLKGSNKRRFIRAKYNEGRVSFPKEGHSSGQLLSAIDSNCVIDIVPGSRGISKGDKVEVILL